MSSLTKPSRRQILALGSSMAVLALSACAPTQRRVPRVYEEPIADEYVRMYAAMPNERFPLPAVNLRRLDPIYYRQIVDDPTGERPGTIVISTTDRFLYLVQENGKAMRYGVGLGRDGFSWSGRGYIALKREWPTWTPPSEMIERQPELEEYRTGMPPSLTNPLGARALYIFQDGRDTLYRIHGNPDETSIGKAVSSGCVRLLQQDVIDLYGRVPVGTKLVVV